MSTRYAADAIILCARAPNAKTIRFGTEWAKGPVDIEDREEGDASGDIRLVRRTIVTVAAGSLTSVDEQSSITINDVPYLVRQVQLVDEGELKEFVCAEK